MSCTLTICLSFLKENRWQFSTPFPSFDTKIRLKYAQKSIPKRDKKQMQSKSSSGVTTASAKSLVLFPATATNNQWEVIRFSNIKKRLSTTEYKSWLISAKYTQSPSHTQEEKWLWVLHNFFFWYYRCENTTNLNVPRTRTQNTTCITHGSFLKTNFATLNKKAINIDKQRTADSSKEFIFMH